MATITSQRPWEPASSSPSTSPQPRNQLPSISALTNNLPENGSSGLPSPASTRERDSGAWSSQQHSTRSSAYSTNTSSYPMSSATNSYYMSPNRMSNLSNSSAHGPTSHTSTDYSLPPTSAGPLSSPGFAPAQQNGLLPSLNQHHDPNRQSIASQASQQSQDGFPKQESRRSSIGSQVNQGMTSLQINGATSPYNSVNHSSTSLAQNLSRERGIPPGSLRNSRSNAQLPTSPLSAEQRPSINFAPRVAPVIGRNPRSDIYNADEPVPGQAYAFPDAPDMEPGALPPKGSGSIRANHSSDGSNKPPFGRRDSEHASIASSVTNDSRLPPGQHRLEDAQPMSGTHHHSLQQHQMSDLNEDDPMTPEESSQPYSRTPALRVSHKMAERKRRSEMKDLFENLRSQIPTSQGSKSSKWEILTKASEYIRQLEQSTAGGAQADKQLRLAMHDVNETRRDNEKLRNENQQLLQELQRLRIPSGQVAPPQASYPSAAYSASAQLHDPGRSLPPLGSSANASSSMQGVEFR